MSRFADQRFRQMEEEMNRFEHEISVPDPNIMVSVQMMGKGTNIHKSMQFVPHQLQRHNQHHDADEEQQSFSSANMTPLGGVGSSSGNSMHLHSTVSAPAVYAARPMKMVTVQPQAARPFQPPPLPPQMPKRESTPPLLPPLAPPPLPPAAINFLPPQSVLHPRHTELLSKAHRKSANSNPREETRGTTSKTQHNLVAKKTSRKKKIVRLAGNQVWEDNSLLDWDPDDFRIFCGDLGNDVTDEVLMRTFGRYPSFVKAKVVRDKRTNKTKGFGFVSFKDPQDFIKAMREMNGKYVGSRPIKLRKSTWKDRNIDIVKKKQKEKERLGLL